MHTPNTPSMPIQQKGYTLVELAIAVAILAVLIVAGLTGVQSILTSGKVNDQIKATAKLGSKISQNFSSTSTSGVSSLTVAQLGGWDTGKYTVTGTGAAATAVIRSSFGSTETLQANTTALSGMAIGTGFVYTIQNIPSTGCPDLANGLNSLVYGIGIVTANSITASDTAWTNASGTTALVKSPGATALVPATVATACAQANTLDFVMLIKP